LVKQTSNDFFVVKNVLHIARFSDFFGKYIQIYNSSRLMTVLRCKWAFLYMRIFRMHITN